MKINIHSNCDRTEFAVSVPGDMLMRATTMQTADYVNCDVVDFEAIECQFFAGIEASGISIDVVTALNLHIEMIESSDHVRDAVCSICDCAIDEDDGAVEIVLFSGDTEICVLDQMHYECDES